MWQRYITPRSLKGAVDLLGRYQGHARIVAGATDLILELERGVRREVDTLIDITRIPGLDLISLDEQGWVHLGPLVTHNHVAGSALIVERAYALARACWEVGAPQIRNRGTLAGNLITASPANDSITPLMALGAQVTLRSAAGQRVVPLEEFYSGVRKTALRADEVLTDIAFPVPAQQSRSAFIKFALRRAQAVSVVNVAVVLRLSAEKVQHAAITLGAVAPTIIHAAEAEAFLEGKRLTARAMARAAELAADASQPIDDVRGSATFRREMVRVCTLRCLRSIASGREREGFPERPVMLWGAREPRVATPAGRGFEHEARTPIETTINGVKHVFTTGQGKTLLRLLREEAGLIGTKEGCAEGECGACTVFLDGMAVMACMVPAPRAHGAEVVTIEGLAQGGLLHPVQQAFIDEGAVQCGYCTPGFILSGAKLLEERPQPTRWEVQQALTGNLCRCTGYYSIVAAIERAAKARAAA
jgi:carbon-monoxide dehydrogenase medium subunit